MRVSAGPRAVGGGGGGRRWGSDGPETRRPACEWRPGSRVRSRGRSCVSVARPSPEPPAYQTGLGRRPPGRARFSTARRVVRPLPALGPSHRDRDTGVSILRVESRPPPGAPEQTARRLDRLPTHLRPGGASIPRPDPSGTVTPSRRERNG